MSRVEGQAGEDLASEVLVRNRYRILEKNYHSRFGEIDIIAEKNRIIHFIEVKYRKNQGFGLPQEFVTKSKINKILKTAKIYLYENEEKSRDWQLDVFAIEKGSNKCEFFENILIEGLS